jgi:hypothetical protein
VNGLRKAARSTVVWTTIEPPVTTIPMSSRFAFRISIALLSISRSR